MAKNRYFEDEVVKSSFQFVHFKRLLKYVSPYRLYFLITLLLVLVTSGLSVIGPYLTKMLVDDIVPKKDIRGVILIGLVFSGSVLIQIIFTIQRVLIMTRTGHNIIYDIRRDVFSNLQRLSFDYFDNRPTGKTLVRVTAYINSLSGLLSDGIINTLANILTLFAIIGVMLTISVKLTLVSLATCIPLIFLIFAFRKLMRKWWRQVSNTNSNREAFIHESIMGAKVVQTFVREKENYEIYRDLNKKCIRAWISTVIRNNLFWPCVDLMGTIGFAATFIAGLSLLDSKEVTIGTIIAFSTYVGRFWAPINDISAIINQFLTSLANTEKIFEVIDEKPEIQDSETALELKGIRGEVEFRNVSFAYEDGETILKNINFRVHPGENIALVGPTGAGKTTVVNLIARFYDAGEGAVLIDGTDIREASLKSLRTQVGVMMQDSFIFAGTILDNIKYGRPDASYSEVVAAAEAVYADRFINKLSQGYYSTVDERGSSLSTGERQLLSFARIILADPRIIILDEATSSIDTKTDMLIQKALYQILKGRTSFVIAHRLSTIKNADRIMYINGGKVTEEGSHEELMRGKGDYFKLYESQFGIMETAVNI